MNVLNTILNNLLNQGCSSAGRFLLKLLSNLKKGNYFLALFFS